MAAGELASSSNGKDGWFGKKLVAVNCDDQLSSDPHKAWQFMRDKERRVSRTVAHIVPSNQPKPVNCLRFVCLSDTHDSLQKITDRIPAGDVLLHAGDFTRSGDLKKVSDFNAQLGTLPHPLKIVIAGNHELTFDPNTRNRSLQQKDFKQFGVKNHPREQLTNCVYLEDESYRVQGINIYGSPSTPEFYSEIAGFRVKDWAFNVPRGHACQQVWSKIPENTDILMTHGPPVGHGDVAHNYNDPSHVGCVDLLRIVEDVVQPRFHVFGHIHEAYGITTNEKGTHFINASICDIRYRPVNAPIIFDFPLPNYKEGDGAEDSLSSLTL